MRGRFQELSPVKLLKLKCISTLCMERILNNLKSNDLVQKFVVGEGYFLPYISPLIPKNDLWNRKIYFVVIRHCGYQKFWNVHSNTMVSLFLQLNHYYLNISGNMDIISSTYIPNIYFCWKRLSLSDLKHYLKIVFTMGPEVGWQCQDGFKERRGGFKERRAQASRWTIRLKYLTVLSEKWRPWIQSLCK